MGADVFASCGASAGGCRTRPLRGAEPDDDTDSMAKWRNAYLESIVGGLLDGAGLTWEGVTQFIGQPESEVLDFKSGTSPYASRDPKWPGSAEWAKDCAAFANRRGGLIVIGLGESGDRADHVEALGVVAAALTQRLLQGLASRTAPVVDVDLVPVRDDATGAELLVVVVPPGRYGPHAVIVPVGDDAKRPLRYPVRDGTDTRWMTEPEVADRYQQRATAAADRQRTADQVLVDGVTELSAAPGTWVHVAVVPDLPQPDELTRSTPTDVRAWLTELGLTGPLGTKLDMQPSVKLNRVVFGGERTTSGLAQDSYLELHGTGAVFAAVRVWTDPRLTIDPLAGDHTTTETDLVDALLLGARVAAAWSRRQGSTWGPATALAGVSAQSSRSGGRDGEFVPSDPRPISLLSRPNAYADLAQRANTRELAGQALATTRFDLDTLTDTPSGRGQVVARAADQLLQQFGIPQTDLLDRDGTLMLAHWHRAHGSGFSAVANDPVLGVVRAWAGRTHHPTRDTL